uniref:Msx2-interacting protein n=1 Tax=Brugia malayi TaxID=6279 RepID=A0A7I4K4Z1_BRUMA
MVISAQVLSINVGGSSNNSSNGNNNNKGTKSCIGNKNKSSGTEKITTGDEIENQEDQQQKNQECSINSSVAKTPSAVWFKHQPQQHPKWLLNCCSSNLTTAAQQLTVLIDSISIGSCIPNPIVTPTTNISIIATAADSRNTTIPATTAVSTTTVPDTTTEQDMSRESRHVHVIGLPDSLSDERVSSFFSTFGRVQKVERLGTTGFVVSFMDVRSAQKAHSAEPKFQGHQLRIAFHEQSKNGLVNPTTPSNAAGLGSPQNARNASSGSTTTDSHRRSSDHHSPNSSSSKQIQKERISQHRLSSSRRQSRERERDRERGNSSRTDERSQRSRISGSNDRRTGAGGGDSRTSRRSRHSPRASASSDSSRDSGSPSGSSGHHHYASNTHTVQSTIIKPGASGSRRNDTNACNELPASCGNHDSLSSASQGFQGIYVSNLPSSRTEGFLRDGLTNFFKKFGKVVHIMFETESGPNFVEQRRALVIFQRLLDADKLKDVHHLFGLRLKIRFASHTAVTEAYSTYLTTNGQECLSSQDAASTSGSSVVDALANRASRTLYVGGLERRTTDDSLRSRFSCFGHILETEVKNWESPSPFAFIQFADIHSVVCAINAHVQTAHSSSAKSKLKMNWGRTIVSNKIWIGELPSSCSADYLREKIRVSFTDTFNEVIYDSRHREALLLFSNNDSAQRAFSMIKTKQVAFWNADEKKDVHVPVDYCSEKLHDYFVDRKFRGESGNAPVNSTGPSSYAGNNATACSSGGSVVASTSTSSLLAPPPDPPSHLRDTSSRVECRRSSSNMLSRRRRSDERDGCRTSRSLRYSSYNRSRRRRERTRRNDISPSSSSTSSTSSDSDVSSSSTPDRKRTGHSKSNIQRLHRDKTPVYPSSSRQHSSPSNKSEQSNSTIGNTLQTVARRSSSRASLVQLLPPPMPSAQILNPIITTSNDKKQQEYHQPIEPTTNEPDVRCIDFKRQQFTPSSSLSVDSELSHEGNGKSTAEQRSKKTEQQQPDSKRLENKESHDSGLYNSGTEVNFTANEINTITSNRIEEIANTLVNVLQHHSKASTSTTTSAPLAIMSGSHQSHSSTCSIQRSIDDICNSSRHHSSRPSTSLNKRTKWPWGNDPIKNHCAIPLDGSANRGKDPRHRKYSSQASTSLPLPKFVHEHHSAPSSRRNSIPDPFRSPQQQRQDSKCPRNSLSASSSGLPGCNLKWNATENSPPQKVSRGRTHSSVSRSESSNSEAMLSPDPSTTQPSLITTTIDIFGDTSPANNSSAYRERLDALGATFQNIEQKFQKTKQNTHLDYDRKGTSQRSYKFEEELERLKARTGSSSSTVATSQSATSCSHSTSNTFTDSFTRVRSGSGTTSIFDSKDAESQKLIRNPLSLSIPMPPAPVTSTSSSPYTPIFYTTCTTSCNLPSPQFSGAQLRKPLLPPSITQGSNQTPPSAAASRIAYPPDFSIPPPPLPQPPVPPTLSLTTCKSAAAGASLISAPPPPPPLICNSTSQFDPASSCMSTVQPLARSAGPQSSTQSSSWRTTTKPSTPPPPASHSAVSSKQTSVSSAPSTTKPPTSSSLLGNTTLEMDKVRSRTQGSDKVQVRDKEHMKINSKSHLPEKKGSKDSTNKQPSLSELFRQQAQDSSEVFKKQLKKIKKEKSDEASHHKSNDESKKGITEATKEKHSKLPEKSDQSVAEREKDKHADGKGQSQETKLKIAAQKQLKEKKEKKELREKDKEHERGELTSEKKSQRPVEKSIKNKPVKDCTSAKQREKREKEQLQKDRTKKKQEQEKHKQKEKEKEQRKKELAKKKRKRKRESSTSSSEETSSSEVELHSFDRELKRLFMEEEASGSLGLSMYDRVKQRSSSKPDDTAKKNRALELLQERTQSRRNNEQNRPKRVQLESSSSDEKDSSNSEEESGSSSGPSVDVSKVRNKKKKTESKGKSARKAKSVLQKKLLVDDEVECNDDDDDGVDKDSERSESEEEHSKRRRSRKIATSKSCKKQKKTTSLSLDDVFGTYSTDDESTKHSRGSIVPSLYKEKDEKEEGKKAVTKIDGNQKLKDEKEKAGNTRRLSLKKERKKEKLEESDDESCEEGKKTVPRKVESKQVLEKSVERKVTGKKRCSKNDEVCEAAAIANTVEVPEKKKQKVEKSLIEISMFREDNKKTTKAKTSTTPEQKKKNRKPGISGQFEKKLAKKLKREQKERYEEQKREAAMTKQKDERLQDEGERQKMDKANSDCTDGTGPNFDERSPKTAIQSHESSSTKGARKRHLRAENSEQVKRSRKEPKSLKVEMSGTDSDSYEDLKKNDALVMKQEPSSKSPENFDANNIRNNISGPESKSDLPSDGTNTGPDIPQLTKISVASMPGTVEMEHTEMDCVSEECATNIILHTTSNEYPSPQNTSHDESDQSKKYDSVEQKLETDRPLVTADNDIVSRHPQENTDRNQNQPKQQQQELCTSDDDERDGGRDVDRCVIGRKNSVSSTNSSESGQTSLLSTSSANLETQLEDGPEDQNQQQILGSEKIRISGSAEILKTGRSRATEQECVEKAENEEKLFSSDVVSEGVIFVPNSDAECSIDLTVHGADIVSNAVVKQQQQPQNVEGSGASILDSVNDAESNGSFELIDEGRVGDVDSLPDQDIDSDSGGIRQQQRRESTYKIEHLQKETVMEVEEHVDGSECIATVRVQDDVHDVQETEFAVQSIVLDDNRSQHSGEDGSAAMDYLSEGVGSTNSRRASLTDTAGIADLSANKQQEESDSQDNADVDSDDIITSKLATDAEHQEMQLEDTDGNKSKMDTDDKRSDSHLDEKAKEEAVLRAAAASTQGSITQKVLPSTTFSRGAETSQYDYQSAAHGPSHTQQQQYGSSGYHMQQSQQQRQLQMPQQITLQQGLLSQPPQQQQQLQQNIVHGNSHMVLQQQQQQHMGQAIMQQQQQQGTRLTTYQQSQSQIMKVPETTYLQQQHLPPIEQRVQGTTAIPQQQQSHPLQSKNVATGNLPSYYSGRNAVQQAGTASFTSPQMPLQQQQQHLFLQQQQTADNMQNIANAVGAGAVHAVSQLSDARQQVVQATPSQQQTTQLVAQSHLQQQQSINYGSPMMSSTCSTAAVVAAQSVAAASRQLDLNKQMGLSTTPLQESISSSPYDLYANLPKKPATGATQPQHQQQTQITQQQQQQGKVSAEVRHNHPIPSPLAAPLMGRTGATPSSATASNLQASRSSASTNTAHQINRTVQHQQQQQQQQQLSPTAQQAVAFAIGLPGTTSPFTQMQQQYLQQMYRSTLFNTFQAAAATSAYSGGNVAAAAGAYGPGGYSGPANNPTAAAVAVAAAGVLPGTVRQDTQRQQQQQPHLAVSLAQFPCFSDLQQQQQQYLTSNLYQQSSPATTLCSPQQANIAAQQLNSLYGAATGAFPISCESSLLSTQQMTGQSGIYHVGAGQRQQDVKQSSKQKQQQAQQQQQQVKTYAGLPAASVIARYPVMWQGIIALKTNETRVQMHKVGGNAEMCKRSLDQFTTTSNHMPLIRINQRMRMEAGQLESVQCKMMDEHSYIALICLSCGPSKEDIKSQSELLKERFVDYLESKQAAGICNVGNEQNPTPNTIVHIFPPCDFASAFLQKNSPDLLEIFRQQKASYLFVVITSAN